MKTLKSARAAHLKLGRFGEDTAVRLMKLKGYQILARNYKLRSGEVDIAALDGNIIVFAEVKTIRAIPGFTPGGNLSRRQLRRNRITGQYYLKSMGLVNAVHRYDLVEIVVSRKGHRLIDVVHSTDILGAL